MFHLDDYHWKNLFDEWLEVAASGRTTCGRSPVIEGREHSR